MKAARLLGPKKRIVVREIASPHPGPNEVVVKIKASGVCHSDLHIAEADFSGIKYPLTLGHEPAGYVYETGSNVQGLKEGTPVVVYITRGCGTCWLCRRGEENNCPQGEAMGFDRDGSHAEFLLVDSPRYLFPVPGVNIEEAAPLACAGLTAYHAVKSEALPALNAGDYSIVVGIGGLGHIAIQLLNKLSPCQIIAIDSKSEKLRLAKELGANHTLLADAKLDREIRKLAPEGVGVVLDFVGSTSSLKTGYGSLRSKGRLVVVGAGGGSIIMNSESTRGREIHGSILGSLDEMQELVELAKAGAFRVLHQRYPLVGINDSFKAMKEGRIKGRAVLTM